jgi:hypothetical protein
VTPQPAAVPEVEETPPPEPVATTPAPASPPTPRPRGAAQPRRPELCPDDPTANLAFRVRRPLDDRLAEVVAAFRREGIRTSKVELVSALLWHLPLRPTAELRTMLREYRAAAEEPL